MMATLIAASTRAADLSPHEAALLIRLRAREKRHLFYMTRFSPPRLSEIKPEASHYACMRAARQRLSCRP